MRLLLSGKGDTWDTMQRGEGAAEFCPLLRARLAPYLWENLIEWVDVLEEEKVDFT